ncbi:MAG: hypothetical protein R3268_11775 [Acidiferrobacterales bacterium]|nr:hypothetical protein [Acidiferrobacterales bacterium]
MKHRYLYRSWPSLLRSRIVGETAKFVYLGETEHLNVYTEKWGAASTYLTPTVTRVPKAKLNNPKDPKGFWTDFDVRWIERRRRENEKQRREQKNLRVSWEIKYKGFQAYDASGKRIGRVWAPSAEEALRNNPTVAYVEYSDRVGKVETSAGRKPKELKR